MESQDITKTLKKKMLLIAVIATLALSITTLIGCDSASNDGSSASDQQSTSPDNSTTTPDEKPEGGTGAPGFGSVETPESALPEGIPEPQNMNPNHSGYDNMRAKAIAHAQDLLNAGEAESINAIYIFRDDAPDGYVVSYMQAETGKRMGSTYNGYMG